MKRALAVIHAVLLASCTSSVAMLQTDRPESKEYRFIFGHMLLDYGKSKDLSPASRMHDYEKQLNAVLQQDANTSSCSIVPRTITSGEPGATGQARVHCALAVKVQIQEGMYNRDGSPFYFYVVPLGDQNTEK